jgi:hypothetical protein
MIGIYNAFRLAANQAVTASVTLVTMTTFSIPVSALKKVHCRLFVPFSLAASGGYKFQWVVPAAPTNFINTYTVTDTVTPTSIVGLQTSSAAFANALAVAGNHFLNCELDFVNGATAGTVDFQFACNSAAGVITALQGAYMDVTFL